jgi:hypothetical protein
MIINEQLNYNESVQFLLSMRKAVSASVLSSKKLSEVERIQLKNFILNEASDYEIMNLAMNGDLPQNKFDLAEEVRLFSKLKEQILINYESISTILEPQEIAIFMESVGPIYPEMSTALPVLEHKLMEADDNVDDTDMDKGKATAALTKAAANKMVDIVKGGYKSVDDALKDGVNATGAEIKKAWEFWGDPEKRKQAKELAGEVAEKGLSKAKNAIDKARGLHDKDLDYASRHPEARPDTDTKADIEHAAGKAKEVAGKAIEKGKEAVEKGKEFVKQHAPGVEAKAREVAGKAAEKAQGAYQKAKEVAGQDVHKTLAQGAEKATQAYEKGKEMLGTTGGAAMAATALAGVAAYGASKIYKRFFSQAARACSGKSGPAKDACMKQYKMKAVQAKVSALTRSKATCRKAKNPQKCISAIDAQIQKSKSTGGK